jgi:hypothetical protein
MISGCHDEMEMKEVKRRGGGRRERGEGGFGFDKVI